jgi:hypothetical protein
LGSSAACARKLNLRAALRLVDEETGWWLTELEATLERDAWQPGLNLTSDQWFAHRNVLAARLASGDWGRLAESAQDLEAIRNIVRLRTTSQSPNALPPPLSAEHRETVKKGVEALKETTELLQVLHSPKPGYLGLVGWQYTERKRERQAARKRRASG